MSTYANAYRVLLLYQYSVDPVALLLYQYSVEPVATYVHIQ